MKKEEKYEKAIEVINQLQKNFRTLSRKEVLNQHAYYLRLVREAAYKGNIEAQYELGLNYEDQNYFIPNPMYNVKNVFIGIQKPPQQTILRHVITWQVYMKKARVLRRI